MKSTRPYDPNAISAALRMIQPRSGRRPTSSDLLPLERKVYAKAAWMLYYDGGVRSWKEAESMLHLRRANGMNAWRLCHFHKRVLINRIQNAPTGREVPSQYGFHGSSLVVGGKSYLPASGGMMLFPSLMTKCG